VVDEQSGRVHLIDFENAKDYTEEVSKQELRSLADELVEDMGRGGKAVAE